VLNQSDGDDVLACDNDDEEAVAMIEESPSGKSKIILDFISWEF